MIVSIHEDAVLEAARRQKEREYDPCSKSKWWAFDHAQVFNKQKKEWVPLTEDMVNSPPHYSKHPSGVECIDITRHMNFNLGNAIKYIWRADLKHDAIEDLRKAMWYLEDEIKRRTK